MSNIFSPIAMTSQIVSESGSLETRIESDGSGNPVYVGVTPTPNAPTSEKVWYIKKMHYDASQNLIRVQQPDDGVKFIYTWDTRDTYFS